MADCAAFALAFALARLQRRPTLAGCTAHQRTVAPHSVASRCRRRHATTGRSSAARSAENTVATGRRCRCRLGHNNITRRAAEYATRPHERTHRRVHRSSEQRRRRAAVATRHERCGLDARRSGSVAARHAACRHSRVRRRRDERQRHVGLAAHHRPLGRSARSFGASRHQTTSLSIVSAKVCHCAGIATTQTSLSHLCSM
mmetsp:Transcript_21227/g.36186  ORF Transcript_21227/g.36186 Transcript_21227/m.36186 type:complete len:201 (+) Transcript_21227:599-1201(+)